MNTSIEKSFKKNFSYKADESTEEELLQLRNPWSYKQEIEWLVMAKSCKGLAEELVKCLSESDCIKVQKRSFRECAGETTPCIPSDCVGLRETYFNCKRGQVDMRARIRGNKGY